MIIQNINTGSSTLGGRNEIRTCDDELNHDPSAERLECLNTAKPGVKDHVSDCLSNPHQYSLIEEILSTLEENIFREICEKCMITKKL